MHEEDEDFENEVRRIARALWPEAQYSGAAIIDGRERDGIFETEECINLLEATTSRKLDKAKQDIDKLVGLAMKFQRSLSYKAVHCWLVTRDEPTADQRQAVKKHPSVLISVLAFSQFQARLMDVRAYLSARDNYPFGSVRDPVTGSMRPTVDYVPLGLADSRGSSVHYPDDVVDFIEKGKRLVLLGDYGTGKSMTLLYIYKKLSSNYLKRQSSCFPVYLNLRDHAGQVDASEIIERHARTIGFDHPSHLVRAWRAGYVYLLLDGFDEVTTLNIQGQWQKLRDSRYRAMEPIRRLISDHPPQSGIVVAGRAHFFDTEKERRNALGLKEDFLELSLNEFTDEQIQEYLKQRGIQGAVPSWFPSRPLLVAYLASRGLLDEVVGEWAAGLEPAAGWNLLLDKIALREAKIEAGIDGHTVRRILERLATKARTSSDGLAPLTTTHIIDSFREICGYPPDDRGMLLLQRLPGLGIDQGESETRRFIDESFVETCRAGDLCAFTENPYDTSIFSSPIDCAAGPIGISVAAMKFEAQAFSSAKLTAAAQKACALGNNYIAGDLVCSAIEARRELAADIYIKDILIPEIEFSPGMVSAARVHFQDCLFGELELDPQVEGRVLPRFHRCFIAALDGRVSLVDIPGGIFEDCIVDTFTTSAGTTKQVLDLPIPMGVRVLITVLKKLFERKGRGRKENAFYRGLDLRAQRFVPDVLQLLKAQGIAFPHRRAGETLWLPERTARTRAAKIIAAPSVSDDPLVVVATNFE